MSMGHNGTERRAKEVLAQVMEQDPATIDEDTTQAGIPSWDSLRHLELIMALESEFQVIFGMDEIATLTSFQTICRALGRKQRG